MFNLLHKKKQFSVTMLGLSIVLLVCATQCGSPPEDQITIIDKKETQKETVVEELLANNCTGQNELTQDLRALKQFTRDIQIVPFPGVKVNTQAVENQIRQTYKIPDANGEQVCIVPVQVPAGTFYSYDLEWREVWREGEFELGDPDETPEGTYQFKQSMICEVVGLSERTCP